MPAMHKLSNYKTTIEMLGGIGRVVYVNTPIVIWTEEGITLNTGGWRSVTTKRKMNQAARQFNLGYAVEQKDFEWFVHWQGQRIPFAGNVITLAR